ncbi:flagellar type III secretion system protein FlhB [Azoarcus communis]|uniref:Flagellar biosynthetic protein FlhB n=1 Tax=Parazoarcus communis SWub3 = DSM 12120 TaxID=1121029 RepID=A0A323UYX3_9RHOO|nr:flagellar biosynthesis protein FlhB [Parazoarcus communis]NMG47126.1 flagellar type III secretion system protein FlhB [Parazoarcus communis]NMG70423.1 flagellar type III secretion system protein FlhB [Parazoarcus communis SWub3 = DSM 12120]PZA17153.1 flagellar biosynthetic protein FlhB [Azoarcus communis] [Parazoarcus communis SWub3 = DSM 12120]
MAEESDLEKTEPASPRRLEQAREEGQVPQSRELSTFFVTVTGVTALWMLGGWMAERMYGLIRQAFVFEREMAFDVVLMLDGFHRLLSGALLTLVPLFMVLLVAAVASPIVLGGLVFSPKALGFNFGRMNPIKGIARMFSVHGLAEMVKAILKSLLIGGIGAMVLWLSKDHLFDLMVEPLEVGMPDFADTVAFTALMIALSLGLLALMDVPFQLWQYHKKLRMTKEEVKREGKEQEGDPQVKGRIRAMQREMARRRMMAEVPKADVVVTNPTHFSVALKYDADKMAAPVVVAKGRGELALKIREIARENKIAMLEAPPLARALYAHCELEQAVPATLFTAVAEVMAYVYQLNYWMANGGLPPDPPDELPVPEGLDPGAPEE